MMKKKVAVNKGHGMKTQGKQTPDGYKEYLFNHQVIEFIEMLLIINGYDVQPCYTKSSVKELTLTQIAKVANASQADYFISVHYNAFSVGWNDAVGGIETYYYNSGKKLAEYIHKELIKGTPLKNRGVKRANFTVLKNTSMPAVLVECGFMTNRNEAKLMKSLGYQYECAEEIVAGICLYDCKVFQSPKFDRDWKLIIRGVDPLNSEAFITHIERYAKDIPLAQLVEKLYLAIPYTEGC